MRPLVSTATLPQPQPPPLWKPSLLQLQGASGFGTPVALAAPMLSSLGHDPLLTVVCLLIMNTLATQFGAVGTPIWFGFGELGG